jgi:hypothetical protein
MCDDKIIVVDTKPRQAFIISLAAAAMQCSKKNLYSITSSAREQCPLSAISDNSHRSKQQLTRSVRWRKPAM